MSREFLQRLSTTCPRLLSKARLQVDRVSGESVLLYPEGVILLNSTGEAILRLCDGTRSFSEILARLALKYHVEAEVLEKDVGVYLQGIYQQSLLELLEKAKQYE